MSPATDVEAAVIDLCSVVEANMGRLREEYRVSMYDLFLGINDRITKEMNRMVEHLRRLIDQNAFLYDRVVELEKRDDRKKVSGRNRNLQDREKGKELVRTDSPENMDDVRRGVGRRPVHGVYRQAG